MKSFVKKSCTFTIRVNMKIYLGFTELFDISEFRLSSSFQKQEIK